MKLVNFDVVNFVQTDVSKCGLYVLCAAVAEPRRNCNFETSC